MKHLKKYLLACSLFALSFGILTPTVQAEDNLATLLDEQQLVAADNLPTTSLVIEAKHGQILWEENTDRVLDPGYLTHLMTLYLTYDALHKEDITWQSTITANDTHQALSQIQSLPNNTIFAGTTYTLEDLIKLVSIPTATAASYLLAELIEPDLNAFVTKMNTTAQQLGMKQTHFYSPSGLTPESLQSYDTIATLSPEKSNQSTPKDLALLAFHLINQFPEVIDITKQTEVVVQGSLVTQETFDNRNPFLFGQSNAIKGANGLLMDYSNLAQANSVFTATQGDMTVISLILGANETFTVESSLSPTTIAGEALLNRSFENYEYRILADPGQQSINRTTFYLENDFSSVLPKTADATLETKEGRLYFTNHLPLVSDTLPEIAIPYSKNASNVEEQVKDNSFLSFIIQAFEITQLTILASGTIIIGLLIFIMSFFIPKKRIQKDNEDVDSEVLINEDLESFEALPVVSEHTTDTLEEAAVLTEEDETALQIDEETNLVEESIIEEESISSRSKRHTTTPTDTPKWPFHQITFYGGLGFIAIGVMSLIIQSIF